MPVFLSELGEHEALCRMAGFKLHGVWHWSWSLEWLTLTYRHQ
jgi:hypothetical protein